MNDRTLRFILSRLDPRAAAFVMRLGGLDAWPSLDATLAGGGIIAIVIVALTALGARSVMGVLVAVELLALLIMPVVSSVMAAALASPDINSEEFVLLKATNLEGRAAYQGYFLATMYRLRVPLVLTLAGLLALAYQASESDATAATTAILFCLGLWSVCLISAALTLEQAFRGYKTYETIIRGLALVVAAYLLPWCPCAVIASLLPALSANDSWGYLGGSLAFAAFPVVIVYLQLVARRKLP